MSESKLAGVSRLSAELEEVVRELEQSFPDGEPVGFLTEVVADRQGVDAVVRGPTGRLVAIEAKYSAKHLGAVWIED